MKTHNYFLKAEWTGNKGTGTSAVNAYERSHVISVKGKDVIKFFLFSLKTSGSFLFS